MEIVRVQSGGCVELQVDGRLDGYWARHLSAAIDEVLREGTHHARLNLSKTSYLSSAGIRVLLETYQQFTAVEGSLEVVEPSDAVKQVLELAGLGALLASQAQAAAPPAEKAPSVEHREAAGARFEIHSAASVAPLVCRVSGRPGLFASAGFAAADCRVFSLPTDTMAVGLGAFGEDFEGCRERFGEFVAVAGGAACQPTDGTNYPDYMLAAGTLVPRVAALYGLRCQGDFGTLVRFESLSAQEPVRFSSLVEVCREAAGGENVAVVMLAESAGLMGATLKRSPAANGGSQQVFGHPEIRRWLSFSPERSHTRSLALVAGVISTAPPEPLQEFVRPLVKDSALKGHFHAAAFAYRPVQKGKIELKSTVGKLFESGGLLAVLHLLADDRGIAGAGESQFLRGACWVGKIGQVLSGEESK